MLRAILRSVFGVAAGVRAAAAPPPMEQGNAAWARGDLAEAGVWFTRAVEQEADAQSVSSLGMVKFEAGRHDEGYALIHRAASQWPEDAGAQCNLGLALAHGGDTSAARKYFLLALALDPGFEAAAINLATAMQHACDWDGVEAYTAALVRDAQTGDLSAWAGRVSPFGAALLPLAPALRRQVADYHAARLLARMQPLRLAPRSSGQQRIRLGYLSYDFYAHATTHLMAGLLARHDRQRFEVMAFSYGPDDGSEWRERIRAGCDEFVEVGSESWAAVAQRIAAARIDILIDLKGQTGGARPGIVACRPAPLIVNYLGCPGTAGAGLADYFVSDRQASPAHTDAEFSEALLRMPACYQVNDPLHALPAAPAREAEGLPASGAVFACFNQSFKIERSTFGAWMRILGRVPDAVLWLMYGSAEAEQRLRAEAAARGCDPARLVFARRQPRMEHLARHALADLFLDTHTCGAHTTGSDALRGGLPMLVFPAEGFAGRVSASLLHAAGLPEMVVRSWQEYEDMAVNLALDRTRLRALHARLRDNLPAAPLFSAERYCADFESGLVAMWERHSAGLPPAAISL